MVTKLKKKSVPVLVCGGAGVHLQLVGDEDNGLAAKLLPDCIAEDVIRHMGVEGTQWVIQDVNVPVAVQGTGQADSLTLPTAQVGTTFPDLMGQKQQLQVCNVSQIYVTCQDPSHSPEGATWIPTIKQVQFPLSWSKDLDD